MTTDDNKKEPASATPSLKATDVRSKVSADAEALADKSAGTPAFAKATAGAQETSGTPATDSAAELAACRAERDEYLEGWKRAKADIANSKREEAERLERFVKFAAEDLIRDLMPVMDSFDLGVQAVLGDTAAVEGMTRIRTQFESALARRGLDRIIAAAGTPFDPVRHEALGEMPGQGPPGTIAQEVSPGFLFHGKVIRPARVMLVGEQPTDTTH